MICAVTRSMSARACSTPPVLIAAPASAQKMPDIGFESVGRGRPLAASVLDYGTRGGAELDPSRPARSPARAGPPPFTDRTAYRPGGRAEGLPAVAERDLFTSADFYADKALWSDPRYFRCGSPRVHGVPASVLAPPRVITSRTRAADASLGPLRAWTRRARPWSARTASRPRRSTTRRCWRKRRRRGGPSVYTRSRNFPSRRVERHVSAARAAGGAERGQAKATGIGAAHRQLSTRRVGAHAGVPGADGAGGVSPGAGSRAVAVHVLLAGGLHAALVSGGRAGSTR